ncbi:GAP family protein [Pseudonocardia sp. DLS-67]
MSTEALVLALTAVVRPTSTAAVVAILSTERPRHLLVAYLAAGLAFSLAIGTLVVVTFGGLHSTRAASAVHPLFDLVLGVCSLGCAACAWAGWLPRHRAAAPERNGWLRRRLVDPTPFGAAVAGVLTHLPGLVYLAALNAIVATKPGVVNGLFQVAIYNAIWFSLAIIALLLSVYRPEVSRELLEQGLAWLRRHLRVIVIGFFGTLGGYLVVSAVLALARIPS